MRNAVILLALVLGLSAAVPRQVYRQETQRKVREVLGRKPNAEEKALLKKHLKITLRLQKIIARAEQHGRAKQAARARALLERAEKQLYERMKEHAR